MIAGLEIKGFERFEASILRLNRLTILAGLNGSCKSTTLQSLLLLRHASLRRDGVAELNGPYGLSLGWFYSLVNINSEDQAFSIEASGSGGNRLDISFGAGDTEMHASVKIFDDTHDVLGAGGARQFFSTSWKSALGLR